jgi:glycosyltransferase involved in cell wall biosynthesis
MADLISIVVPVYNEVGTVRAVIDRLLTIPLPALREIIVVDDGSRDGTRAVLEGIDGSNPALSIVYSPENRGKGHAVRLGIARSRGTIVAIQDADLELDPIQLAALAEPILRGEAAVVYGSRFLDGRSTAPAMTRIGNRSVTFVTNLLYGTRLTDMETCYKVMRGDVARGLQLTANRFDIEPEITASLLRAGHRIVERPVVFSPRAKAAGKKLRWRDGLHAINVLVRGRFR